MGTPEVQVEEMLMLLRARGGVTNVMSDETLCLMSSLCLARLCLSQSHSARAAASSGHPADLCQTRSIWATLISFEYCSAG